MGGNVFLARVHCVVLKQQLSGFPGSCCGGWGVVSVVMARGKRPVTFRTRKLSLSAPMVLHGGLCGRVGRRRTIFEGPWVPAFTLEPRALSRSVTRCSAGVGSIRPMTTPETATVQTTLCTRLRDAGIGPGDEVIVPSYGGDRVLAALQQLHAVPVFREIDPRTFCLDPAAASAAVGARTVAVAPVHLFGHPADMVCLRALTQRHGLLMVECLGEPQPVTTEVRARQANARFLDARLTGVLTPFRAGRRAPLRAVRGARPRKRTAGPGRLRPGPPWSGGALPGPRPDPGAPHRRRPGRLHTGVAAHRTGRRGVPGPAGDGGHRPSATPADRRCLPFPGRTGPGNRLLNRPPPADPCRAARHGAARRVTAPGPGDAAPAGRGWPCRPRGRPWRSAPPHA